MKPHVGHLAFVPEWAGFNGLCLRSTVSHSLVSYFIFLTSVILYVKMWLKNEQKIEVKDELSLCHCCCFSFQRKTFTLIWSHRWQGVDRTWRTKGCWAVTGQFYDCRPLWQSLSCRFVVSSRCWLDWCFLMSLFSVCRLLVYTTLGRV